MSLQWNGDALKAKVVAAAMKGVNKTLSEAVIQAKNNHPGFNNITGTAEGSIRIQEFAEQAGNVVRGTWGSADVDYFIWLELKRGSPLRSAADAIYPRLAGHIEEAL